MQYRVETYPTAAYAQRGIDLFAAEGWAIHTFSTSGNGYMGGHIITVLYQRP